MVKWVASLIVTLGCGFPRPADVPGDTDKPRLTIQVSPAGNDTNDGITGPVLTLKRAIGITIARTEAVTISLEPGTYGMSSGETFPYTIQSHVTISGPMEGGAMLTGNTTVQGFIVDDGVLQNLELEDFTTAITVNHTAQITNIRVRASDVAVRAQAMAALVANGLDITGTSGSCATGIELIGNSTLTAADISTRGLGVSLRATDNSTIKLSRTNATGDSSCVTPVFDISSGNTFTLNDSLLDGGNSGITFQNETSLAQAILTNVTIRNMKMYGLTGTNTSVRVTEGALASNQIYGANITGGSWIFTRVAINQNSAAGIYLNGSNLLVRGCSISGNGTGIRIVLPNNVDLGSDNDNGNNTIQNRILGILLDKQGMIVKAIGNTWQPNIQGADGNGRYTASVISGPVPLVSGNNYAINDQSTLVR